MAVVIPSLPIATATISLISSAVDQRPSFGGRVQRVARLGDRWTYSVELRPMHAWQSRPIIARLLQGLSEVVVVPLIIPGVPLTDQVDVTAISGAGRSITVTGDTSKLVEGQFFSLVRNGVRHLHMVTGVSDQVINFNPALKVQITGGELLEFAAPKIEGFLENNEKDWTVNMVGGTGLTFKVEEAR